MKIYSPQTLPSTEYLEGQEERNLSPKEGYEIIKIRKNFGTAKAPQWGFKEMYVLPLEDLTIQLSILWNQWDNRKKTLKDTEEKLNQLWNEKDQLNTFITEILHKIEAFSKEQEVFLQKASVQLQQATEESEDEAAGLMQVIMDMINHTQQELQILQKKVPNLPQKQ